MRSQTTTRISSEVLAVLRTLEHHDDAVSLTVDLRDQRELYLQVAEVLEACGAKWDRRRDAHAHTEHWDPGMLADVVATGEAPPANSLAFFPTPRKIAAEMCKYIDRIACGVFIDGVKYATRILEPSAGTGALVHALIDHLVADRTATRDEIYRGELPEHQRLCVEIIMIEQDPRRARILERTFTATKSKHRDLGTISVKVHCGDFLRYAAEQAEQGHTFDAILANPPFSVRGDRRAWRTHLLAMLSVLDERGRLACVVPCNYLEKVGDPDLTMIEVVGASEREEWPKGMFEGTSAATVTLYLDGPTYFDRSWDGESLWCENTFEIMQALERLHKQTDLADTPAVRAELIRYLAEAARGGEHVLADAESVDRFRRKLKIYFETD